MSEVFKVYADYYDLLYRDKNYEAEVDFVTKLLLANQVPSNGTILELGSGTGKHGVLLAEKGFKVHGIDISKSMVEIANLRAKNGNSGKIRFNVGDARTYRAEEKFDAVISLFHVASYQKSNEDLLSMIKTASSHLNVGGVFIFDCWYGPAVIRNLPEVRVKRASNSEIQMMRIAEPTMYPNQNLVDVKYTVAIKRHGDGCVDNFEETHTMRYLFEPEIEMYMQNQGFKREASLEWLTGQCLSFQSWNATFVYRKN